VDKVEWIRVELRMYAVQLTRYIFENKITPSYK